MQPKGLFAIASCFTFLGFFVASCAPAALPPASPKGATQVATAAPAAAPAPSTKPAAGQPKYGGVLARGSRHPIPHFDAHQESSGAIQFPLSSVYSILVQNDPRDEDRIIGDLARSWDISPDGLVYAFLLNEGVKFHNGRTLTSQDVKFNLDRVIFPPKGVLSPRKELYQAVVKIDDPEPLTLKITLKNQQASFLQLLALEENFVFAPEVVKQKGDMKQDAVGTGPFKFQSYIPGVSFKVQKNADYFIKGRPYLDGIVTYILVDETARFAALRTKQIQMVPLTAGPTGSQAEELRKREPRLVAEAKLMPNNTGLNFNTKIDPWNDVRVRRAVNLAIDREAAAKVVRAGSYNAGYGYTLPGSVWALPEQELTSMAGFRKPKDQDVAEARRLLAEAGYSDGFKTTLMTSTTIQAKEAAEFSKDQLARLGISGEIQVFEIAVTRERLYRGAFQISVVADASPHLDPDVLLGEYYITDSAKNYGRWSNPKFDELYLAQSMAKEPAKRREIIWEMQRIIHRESPRIIITWTKYWAVWWDEMKDWFPQSSVKGGHKFQDVWLAR
ncbi:MAG: ABC transporter substrate-binding protein [Chloroflexi bacterium]|nr:ABC transporter substrate-binding protein [Chloroflexota bacterium]